MAAVVKPHQHSGLQKEVLSLYRRVLREAVKLDRSTSTDYLLPSLLSSPKTTSSYAASEFRKQAASVRRSDFQKIEYMIRKGGKQIKLMRMPGVKFVAGSKTPP